MQKYPTQTARGRSVSLCPNLKTYEDREIDSILATLGIFFSYLELRVHVARSVRAGTW